MNDKSTRKSPPALSLTTLSDTEYYYDWFGIQITNDKAAALAYLHDYVDVLHDNERKEYE